ncbi:MAG: glycosyltransferase [Pseudomonadota bacterium]
MNIVYLTAESLKNDPIIESQVMRLVDLATSTTGPVEHVEVVTFEADGPCSQAVWRGNAKVSHAGLGRRGHVANTIALCKYLFLRRAAYQVIHVRSYLPLLPALMAKLFLRKFVIFDPRGLFADEVLYYKKGVAIAYLFKFIEPFLYRYSDAVVVVSERFRDYIMRRYRLPAHRVTHISTFAEVATTARPAELADFRATPLWQSAIILCYSGSLEGWQLFDKVIDFFAMASSISPRFKFVVMSKQDAEVAQLLSGRLPPDSFIVQRATPAQLPFLLRQCDYGVLFRQQHLINEVAAPIKVKDYLLAGLKIVISDNVGDSSSYVRANQMGHVLAEFSEAAMRSMLAELTPVDATEKSRVAETAGRDFSLGVAEQKYREIYASINSKMG